MRIQIIAETFYFCVNKNSGRDPDCLSLMSNHLLFGYVSTSKKS